MVEVIQKIKGNPALLMVLCGIILLLLLLGGIYFFGLSKSYLLWLILLLCPLSHYWMMKPLSKEKQKSGKCH